MNNRSVRNVINCFQSGDQLACVNTASACGTFERLQVLLGFSFIHLWYSGTSRPNPKAESPNFRRLISPTCSLLRGDGGQSQVDSRNKTTSRDSQGQNMQKNLFWKGFQEPQLEVGCTGTQVNPRFSNLLSIARKYLLKALKRICELNLAELKVTATLSLDYSVEDNLKDLSKVCELCRLAWGSSPKIGLCVLEFYTDWRSSLSIKNVN